MSDIAIRVENLSKKYRIGRAQQRHDTLRDALSSSIRGIGERLRRNGYERKHEIWALKDVSFEVKQGEVVGIIGRNGAGKSTLLKILSQITEPTSGRAELHGRVGSLLEVGTGFHPELTGRENIYLSGALLGMTKFEIDKKFDEIYEFAGVGKFIDTPLKRFSSGMQVRLGFAVAAHLDPSILLIDEVLAVGDTSFRKKSLGKMEEVAGQGRTVLFVSHNMSAIANLCKRVCVLDSGLLIYSGLPQRAISNYLDKLEQLNSGQKNFVNHEGSGEFQFIDIIMWDLLGNKVEILSSGQDVLFELKYKINEDLHGKSPIISIAFFNLLGQPLFLCRTDFVDISFTNLPVSGSIFCRVPKLPLPPGEFRINLHCRICNQVVDWVKDARIIRVVGGDFFGTGTFPDRNRGDLLVEHEWFPMYEISQIPFDIGNSKSAVPLVMNAKIK